MQVFAIKMHNFLRFGNQDNCIVFDLKKNDLDSNVSIASVYEKIKENPYRYYSEVKERGINPLIGILGVIDGDVKKSNGSGKSTLLEAICYAHYGKVVRITANNDKKGDAGSLIAKNQDDETEKIDDFWVEEFFEANGKMYRIKRGRSFSKSRKTSSPILEFEMFDENGSTKEQGHRSSDTKLSIDEVNEYPYELFVNTTMFGQNDAGKFLVGTDKVRKEMIIDILKCKDEVQGCQEIIRKKKIAIDKVMLAIQNSAKEIEKGATTIYSRYINGQVATQDMSATTLSMFIDNMIEDLNCKNRDLDTENTDLSIQKDKLNHSAVQTELETLQKEMQHIKTFASEKKASHEVLKKTYLDGMANATRNLAEIEVEKKNLEKQIDFAKKNVVDLKTFQASIDLVKLKEDILKSKRAREVQKENKDKENSWQKDYDLCVKHSNEIRFEIKSNESLCVEMKKQKAKVLNGFLNCPECKSVVPESHVDDKIKEYTEKANSCNVRLEAALKLESDALNSLTAIKEKNNKIMDWILKEADLTSRLNKFESSVKDVEQLSLLIEDCINKMNNLDIKAKDSQKVVSDFNDKIKNADASYEKDIKDKKQEYVSLSNKFNEVNEKFQVINASIKKLTDKINLNNTEKSKNSEKIGLVRKDKENFLDYLSKIKEKTAELDIQIKEYSRYDKLDSVFGLDGIQTKIVHRYMPILNMYLGEYIGILSENLINVELKIDERSDVTIFIKGATSSVYEMLSGGEKMVVHVAMNLALAMLSFVRTKQVPSLICLDEIFGPLDANYTNAIFALLDVLKKKFNRVLLITHNDMLKKQIPCNIIVEKNFGTSSIKRMEFNTDQEQGV